MQGLVVVPLFAGWDEATGEGRIFSYDATGGRYEEHAFFSVGSGSVFARGSLKKLYRPDFDPTRPRWRWSRRCTTRPTTTRPPAARTSPGKIFPVVMTATEDGVSRLPDAEVADLVNTLIARRMERPDGPEAPLT